MPKIASLRNLPAMEEGGIHYSEGFVSRKMNGVRFLTSAYNYVPLYDEDDTGWTGLAGIDGFTQLTTSTSARDILAISDANIFHFDQIFTANSRGKIHTIPTSSGDRLGSTSAPDIFVTDNNNILYSGAYCLGIAYRGVVKATNTDKIIDQQGRNFTTLGMGTTSGVNKVYNLTTGTEYTVTSVSTTDSTNDTLNFTAAPGKTNTVGDYFIAFADKGTSGIFDFYETTAWPQYIGQPAETGIVHQIIKFDTKYLITNGNYLAALNEDESTWDDNYKQLPDNTAATCISGNQTRILIGGSIRGKGRLMLWDGFSDGFLSIIETNAVPSAIAPYSSGWVLFLSGDLYFTDGYSLKKITTLPDADYMTVTPGIHYNGLITVGERVLVHITSGLPISRYKGGLWVYEFGNGWTYKPLTNSQGNHSYPAGTYAIKSFDRGGVGIVGSYAVDGGTGADYYIIANLFDASTTKPSMRVFVDLKEQIDIKRIGLSLNYRFRGYESSSSASTATIGVNVGDAKKSLYGYSQTLANSTTSALKVNGTLYAQKGTVGEEIIMSEGPNAGQRSFITAIANSGSNPETWTISPVLTATPEANDYIERLNMRSCGTKVLTGGVLPEAGQLYFDVSGILTDKIYVEVYMTGNDSSQYDIIGLDIYA